MSHFDAAEPTRNAPQALSASPITSPLLKLVTLIAIGCLLGYIGVQGRILLIEWSELRRDVRDNRTRLVVGYVDINPNPSYADRPANWYHHEGAQTLLWSGWKSGSHQWFRIGKGELTREQLSLPFGRDSIQAIDHPMIEIGDGIRWRRIPDEATVMGLEIAGKVFVCPLKVLEKVEVINHLIDGIPFVITYAPYAIEEEAVTVYDAAIDGRRLTLGVSGYFLGRQPIFYDRETESLWAGTDEGLSALAGPRKGKTLKTVGRPVPVAWSDWRSKYPQSQLVVGAIRPDRSDLASVSPGGRTKSTAQPAP